MPPGWAPELGDVPVGLCPDWEGPSVLWEGMAATRAGQEPLAMTQLLCQGGDQSNHPREEKAGAELPAGGWTCRITPGFATMLF